MHSLNLIQLGRTLHISVHLTLIQLGRTLHISVHSLTLIQSGRTLHLSRFVHQVLPRLRHHAFPYETENRGSGQQ